MYFYSNIEKHRISVGLTRRQLADLAGVSIRQINNGSELMVSDILRIAKILGVKASTFYNNPALSEFSTHDLITELTSREGIHYGMKWLSWDGTQS